MKAEVTEIFADRFDGTIHREGEMVDFDEKRIADLMARGLVRAAADDKDRKTAAKRKTD